MRRGQHLARLVMVHDQGGEAEFGGAGQRVMRHHAAIERHQQLRAIGLQLLHRALARAIALRQAVGDVNAAG